MIPQNLHWAFEDGHRVHTLAGTGRMKKHRLADLVLPSGKIATGLPGQDLVNIPNPVQLQVPPGAYPVFLSSVSSKGAAGAFAFVAVMLRDTKAVAWEAAGSFFTDTGDGCLFDASLTDLFLAKKRQLTREQWWELKTEALHEGDGNLVVDEMTGANAIIFRSGDLSFGCFAGRDQLGQLCGFVIDGRPVYIH